MAPTTPRARRSARRGTRPTVERRRPNSRPANRPPRRRARPKPGSGKRPPRSGAPASRPNNAPKPSARPARNRNGGPTPSARRANRPSRRPRRPVRRPRRAGRASRLAQRRRPRPRQSARRRTRARGRSRTSGASTIRTPRDSKRCLPSSSRSRTAKPRPTNRRLPRAPRPLAMWVCQFEPVAETPAPLAHKGRDEFRALVSQFSIPHAVAAVSYPSGARIRRVKVPAVSTRRARSAADPRVVILSRKLLKASRRQTATERLTARR